MSAATFEQQITFLATGDLEKTAEFYERVLGLRLALDQGACRIHAVGDGAYVGFCRKPEGNSPEGVVITFVTEDVDGWHERLAAKGVAFEKPPTMNEEYRIYHCFLRDPSGYLVEIQRFEDPAWQE